VSTWVVGASGKIGRALSERLLELGERVVGVGRHSRPSNFDIDWIAWDPAVNRVPLSALPPAERVYFLAGQTSPAKARQDVAGDVTANLVTLLNVVSHAAVGGSFPHVITAGSATEWPLDLNGLVSRPPISLPVSLYETSKAAQRLYLAQLARENLIDFTTLRLANVYGGHASRGTDRGFLDRCLREAVQGGPVAYFTGSDFARDYVHVEDVVEAFVLAGRHRPTVRNRVFDIGTGVSTPIRDVMVSLDEALRAVKGVGVRLIPQTPPPEIDPADVNERTVSPLDFFGTTGWQAQVELPEGLRRSVLRLVELSERC
jgi:UDP-glucose 4-epimerase